MPYTPPVGVRAFCDIVERDDDGHWVYAIHTWDDATQTWTTSPPLHDLPTLDRIFDPHDEADGA